MPEAAVLADRTALNSSKLMDPDASLPVGLSEYWGYTKVVMVGAMINRLFRENKCAYLSKT